MRGMTKVAWFDMSVFGCDHAQPVCMQKRK